MPQMLQSSQGYFSPSFKKFLLQKAFVEEHWVAPVSHEVHGY